MNVTRDLLKNVLPLVDTEIVFLFSQPPTCIEQLFEVLEQFFSKIMIYSTAESCYDYLFFFNGNHK